MRNKAKWYSFLLIWLALLLASSVVSCALNPRYIYENGALQVGGDGEPIELINNPDATDPTYAELIAFIKADITDESLYTNSYVCSDFAEAVHNNAEAAGIRAAWVGIDFDGDEESHACNAFETTDLGLVYIDSIGENPARRFTRQIVKTDEGFSPKKSNPTSWDKVAYVEIGKEYGLMAIDKAESLLYSFYEEYKEEWQEYQELLSDYNEEVMRYNQEIKGKVYDEGSPELARIQAWEARLKKIGKIIDRLGEELGDFRFEPLGIVEDIHIYWGREG